MLFYDTFYIIFSYFCYSNLYPKILLQVIINDYVYPKLLYVILLQNITANLL
jgi:hypothetical protein